MEEVNTIYDLVPNRTLCRKLSKRDFKDSSFVWLRINGDSFKDSYWVLETRERLDSLQVKLEYEIWLPAPSVEDLLRRLPEGVSICRIADFYVAVKDLPDVFVGKTCVEALTGLYIQLKKQ